MPNRPTLARPGLDERPEPHLAAPGVPAPRPAMPRPLAARPAGDLARGDNPPLRFPVDQRRSPEAPRLTLSAEDRLIVSGAAARGEARPRRGALRGVLLAALLVLAGIGAFTVYQAAAGILHP